MPGIPPQDDTIVALSTPPGRGGLGAVRLTGPRAAAIASALFRPASGGAAPEHGRTAFGTFVARGAPIDRGYLVTFHPPRSFTGEETAELWAHGSPPVLRALVEAAVAAGARPAAPGEFTLRAVLNGRIDLTRAEAIRDLIEASTLEQARAAHQQAEGRVALAVAALKEGLVEAMARIEAAVEFSDEPEAPRFLPEGGILARLHELREAMDRLAASFDRGRRLRDGAGVALSGAPNVGKSSLFNRLLEEDRAIVTAIAGTTRDPLEETVAIDGVPVRLIDCAGITAAADEAGAEAVRRAAAAAERADLVLVVLDASRPLMEEERGRLAAAPRERTAVAINKIDRPGRLGAEDRHGLRERHDAVEVSALTGAGLDDLKRLLRERLEPAATLLPGEAFLTSLRQRDLVRRASEALRRAEGAGRDGLGGEYLAIDLRRALDRLGEITGEVGLDAIYDRLFSTFCIGK